MSAKWLLQSWWIRLLTTFLQDFDAVAGIPCLVVFSPAVHLLYFCFNNTHEGPTQQQFPNYFNLPLIVLRRFPNWILSIKNDSSLKQDWALEFKVQLLTQTPGMQDWCLFFFFLLANFTGLDHLSKPQHAEGPSAESSKAEILPTGKLSEKPIFYYRSKQALNKSEKFQEDALCCQ